MRKPLIIASNLIEKDSQRANYYQAVQKGAIPRQDVQEIASRLGADIVSPEDPHSPLWRHGWNFEKRLKFHLSDALRTVGRLEGDQVVLSTSEKVALPLAGLLQLRHQPATHIMIAHKLSSGRKTLLLKAWPLQKTFRMVICVSRMQVTHAIERLQVPAEQVNFVYDKVDHYFFRPQKKVKGDYVLAVGQEQRDYATLLKALQGTGLPLVLVPSSRWARQNREQVKVDGQDVQVASGLSYPDLRALYAGARVVVNPLFEVDYAAGVNSTLEAMAMARPLIISQTRGMADYVFPGQTAVTVPVGDSFALREAVLSLWGDCAERQRVGENGRQLVEERMNLDIYVRRIAEIVENAQAAPR